MSWLATGVSMILLVLAGLHVYWGLGGVWPGDDPRSLALTVAGFKGVQAMPPPLACLMVAAALIAAAAWAQTLAGVGLRILPHWLAVLGGIALSAIFLVRGVAAYLPAWRAITPEQPFASYDVALYGPLCLFLGASFAVLTFFRFSLK
jgi:hypothetical protein